MTVYLLDFWQYTKRQTNAHCNSQSKFEFTSVLKHRTKRSTSKKLAMKRCSDQITKGKKKIYCSRRKVYETQVIVYPEKTADISRPYH